MVKRNEKTAEFSLDVGADFEIPDTAEPPLHGERRLHRHARALRHRDVGKPVTVPLNPFEVLVPEFTPQGVK